MRLIVVQECLLMSVLNQSYVHAASVVRESDHVVHRLLSGISCDDNRLTGCELFMSGQELLYVCHIRSPTVDLT